MSLFRRTATAKAIATITVLMAALFTAKLNAAPAKSGNIDFSGSVDALLSGAAGTDYGGGMSYSYGFEQYSNLRLKARIGERGTFYAAANLFAATGSSVAESEAADEADILDSPYKSGSGYAFGFEPERLYFRIEGDAFDAEAGLMRLAFGYGQAWSPSDFLSPRNPLLPDARTRGVLAMAATAYPTDAAKLKIFVVGPKNPLETNGTGVIVGATADAHLNTASYQVLYAWQAAAADASVHRIGFSAKVEAEIGIALDALYTLDGAVLASGMYYNQQWNGLQGLQAGAGFDYTLLEGDLYILFQYLYNGGGALAPGEDLGQLYASGSTWYQSVPAARTPLLRSDIPYGELNRKNYLYGAFTYRFDDYTNATADCVSSLDDLSFSPSLTLAHEPFQGLALSLSCRVPLDARTFSSDGAYGELGPTNTGTRVLVTAKAKAKF